MSAHKKLISTWSFIAVSSNTICRLSDLLNSTYSGEMGSAESKSAPASAEEPVDNKATMKLINPTEQPSVPSSSLSHNDRIACMSSSLEQHKSNSISITPDPVSQHGKSCLEQNKPAHSNLTRRTRLSYEEETSIGPIQTPLLLPKKEKPDTPIRHLIPRDPRQTVPLPPQSENQRREFEKEMAEQLILASQRTEKTQTVPKLSSVIDIKIEPLGEDEVDDSIPSDWMDPWLNNTSTTPDQRLPNEGLAKPTEEVNDSDDSVSTVGLPSPTRLSPVPTNNQAESERDDVPVNISSIYSPTVEFFGDDGENSSEGYTKLTMEDFDDQDVDHDASGDDDGVEETFAVNMIISSNSLK